jgi:transposase-like protein
MEVEMNYSNEEKTKLVEGWRLSGKSISAYVKEKGLVRWTFTKWIKAERGMKSSLVEVPAQIVKTTLHMPEILVEKGDVKIHIPLVMGLNELREVMEGLGAAL